MSPAAAPGSAATSWVSTNHPCPTERLIARAIGAPLAFLYYEDDKVAAPMPALHGLGNAERNRVVQKFVDQLAAK